MAARTSTLPTSRPAPGISINLAASRIEWVADFAGGNDTIDGSGMSVNLEIFGEGGTDNVTGGSGKTSSGAARATIR